MSTPDGYIVEGHVEDGLWAVLTAHRERAAAEAWIDDWPHWRAAGARIRPFRYTDAPASGEPSGAEAVVREAAPFSDTAVARIIEAVEKHCGMGRGAWDMVSARDLVEGFAAVFGADTSGVLLPTAPGAPEEGAGA